MIASPSNSGTCLALSCHPRRRRIDLRCQTSSTQGFSGHQDSARTKLTAQHQVLRLRPTRRSEIAFQFRTVRGVAILCPSWGIQQPVFCRLNGCLQNPEMGAHRFVLEWLAQFHAPYVSLRRAAPCWRHQFEVVFIATSLARRPFPISDRRFRLRALPRRRGYLLEGTRTTRKLRSVFRANGWPCGEALTGSAAEPSGVRSRCSADFRDKIFDWL